MNFPSLLSLKTKGGGFWDRMSTLDKTFLHLILFYLSFILMKGHNRNFFSTVTISLPFMTWIVTDELPYTT
jgi:hypothetical protein